MKATVSPDNQCKVNIMRTDRTSHGTNYRGISADTFSLLFASLYTYLEIRVGGINTSMLHGFTDNLFMVQIS